ncbi:Dullard-like phosphatase domain protein [Ancylostoma ceylanicum]|uniref:Dullard-like phosphatase domain protein n=1 Tax=Ancylostoma ceylanicum TaxID=53326 RepID=A0A0D6LKR8_9BILA|nr:Dullard-like phosphatase domain protein [Ancylostoma ceylanicum]
MIRHVAQLFIDLVPNMESDAVMRRQTSTSSSDRRVHQPSSHLRSMMSVITAVLVAVGTILNFIVQGFKRMHRGVVIDRHPVRFSVHARPHVDYFLSVVSQWFDLVVFTASMEVYGTHVADKLDNGRGILNRRYFRQHCTMDYGGYTKDLSAIHQDLSSIFILDNSPGAYRKFPQNAIPIPSWFSDPSDTCLLNLLPFLDALRFTSDVRSILSRNQQSFNQIRVDRCNRFIASARYIDTLVVVETVLQSNSYRNGR